MAIRASGKGGGVLAIGLGAACLAVLGGLLWGSYQDQTAEREAVRAAAPPQPAPRPAPAPPPAPAAPILASRTDFLTAAAVAANAQSAGAPAPAEPSGLRGRRFRIRLPFGCGGPSVAEPAAGSFYTIDSDGGAVRIVVRPADWTQSLLVNAPGEGPEAESVAGFWISRPWLRTEGCPASGADPLTAEAAQPSPETVGLAMFYEAGASRAARSDSPTYEAVATLEAGREPPRAGLLLVLEGRVTGFEDGRAFRCRSAHPDQRPVCIARVELDSMAVETPESRTPLATWEVGGVSASPR